MKNGADSRGAAARRASLPRLFEPRRRGTPRSPDELGDQLERMRPRLEHLASVRLDPRLRRRVDAGDVVQAAFVDAFQRFEEWIRIHSRMPLFVWVRLLTIQKVDELSRRHLGTLKRDVRREVEGSDPSASSAMLTHAIAGQQESPSKAVIRLEQKEALHLAIEHMKPRYREILMMRYFERLSNEECAHALGLSRAGAKIRYVRARKRLREILERAGLPEDLLQRGDETE